MRPNDKDARAKYNECKKIVNVQAFQKAIAVEDNHKSVADTIDLASMSMYRRELELLVLMINIKAVKYFREFLPVAKNHQCMFTDDFIELKNFFASVSLGKLSAVNYLMSINF